MLVFSGLCRSHVSINNLSSEAALNALRSQLHDTVLSSKAPKTVKVYLYHFRNFQKFAAEHKFSSLPASTLNVALYLQNLMNYKKSSSSINLAACSINFMHQAEGHVQILDNFLVRSVLEAAKRNNSTCTVRDHATKSLLWDLKCVHERTQSAAFYRTFCICLLLFAG